MAPEETYTYTADSREAATYGCDGGTGAGIDSYYDLSGRLIEVESFSPACGGGLSYTMKSQYVWGLDYVNSLVERDDASTSGDLGVSVSGLGVRLYATHDANYNITATTDDSGAVTERFQYDPYGKQTALNASWGAYSGSSTEPWNVGFQGGVQMYLSVAGGFTTDTGLIQFDNRIYDVDLGRWIQQDPAGYVDGGNRYQFLRSNPIIGRDPTGNADIVYPIFTDPSNPGGGGGAGSYSAAEIAALEKVLTEEEQSFADDGYTTAADMLAHFLGNTGTDYTLSAQDDSEIAGNNDFKYALRNAIGEARYSLTPVHVSGSFSYYFDWAPFYKAGLFYAFGTTRISYDGTVSRDCVDLTVTVVKDKYNFGPASHSSWDYVLSQVFADAWILESLGLAKSFRAIGTFKVTSI